MTEDCGDKKSVHIYMFILSRWQHLDKLQKSSRIGLGECLNGENHRGIPVLAARQGSQNNAKKKIVATY